MAVLNSTIIEKAWLEGSNDFQQRISNPLVSGYSAAVADLFQPYNHDLFNEFSGLMNGLMGTYIESKLFENPLRELKKPAATWGNTERHVAVKYLKAHCYRADSETLLKIEKPEYVEWFYSVQKPRRYEFSWSKYELQRVFATDGYGFDDLLSATLTQMYSSDNYDEMTTMIQMFAEGDARFDQGLYRWNISAAPTTEQTGKELLTAIRAAAGMMQFPSTKFNKIDVPVFENSDTLILWVTPETRANLDVQTLSAVFQLDKADIQYRIVTIPEFPIPNVYAALTSEDFIYARDVWYGMEPPFYNPANLTYKYYLHHAEMIGVNPAANCVLFTTDAQTVIPTVTVAPSGLSFSPDTYTCEVGGTVQMNVDLTGNVTGDDSGKIAVEPDAAIYSVSAMRGDDAITLNSRTYVDDACKLHVQKSGLAANDMLTVTATSVYVNPSGATTTYTDTATVTITASTAQGAKECAVETDPYITYTDETVSVTASE
jgi:hypothetical protein